LSFRPYTLKEQRAVNVLSALGTMFWAQIEKFGQILACKPC